MLRWLRTTRGCSTRHEYKAVGSGTACSTTSRLRHLVRAAEDVVAVLDLQLLQVVLEHTQQEPKVRHCEIVLGLQVHKVPLVCIRAKQPCQHAHASTLMPVSWSFRGLVSSLQSITWKYPVTSLCMYCTGSFKPCRLQACRATTPAATHRGILRQHLSLPWPRLPDGPGQVS